ncbi:MAG: prepilin-type N-terminal cleavage/methylation domain-containing protein [Nocardioidaceae bacterium]|nr:prepilin-type N-terminal cleavage/methylation domain-containing protein [Nocardioidaceae bacterium]MCL2612699.1 prepilin-type N-terminal cleavage/methylation domain-containing protein [Nocardioidaceae bacterium]
MLTALQNHRRRSADAGFTLIELLIVIVILGVLAAIVVFSVKGITQKGDTAACQTSVSTIDTAAEAYLANKDDTTTAAGTLTLQQISAFMHTIPTTVGSTPVTASTTVSTIDGITC